MLTPTPVDETLLDEEPVAVALRVVVIDSRPERRAITSLLIDRSPRLRVVAQAADLAEATAQVDAEQADLALLEIQLPITDGLAAIGALRERFPSLRIVVSSFHVDTATRDAARELGAAGYLKKPLDLDELVLLASQPD